MATIGNKLLQVFQKCDKAGDGTVDRDLLVKFLDESGVPNVDNLLVEAGALTANSNRINYDKFVKWLLAESTNGSAESAKSEDVDRFRRQISPGFSSDCQARRKYKFFIGANWKCSLEKVLSADALVDQINEQWLTFGSAFADIELCIFPPYVFLDRVRRQLSHELYVGSQNAWDSAPGFKSTGVVTANMLQAVGCSWVLLGHSDRRNTLHESDALIAEKVAKCLSNNLCVNLTIGETLEAREAGEAISTLTRQLSAAAAGVPAGCWDRIAIAYEPVWAIGEGATPCSPEETQRVHAALRAWLREEICEEASQNCRLVYTGSINETNAANYACLPDVDGFVVGRAGLDIEKLLSICGTLVQCKSGAAPTMPLSSCVKSHRFFLGANWKCSIEDSFEVDKLIFDLNEHWRNSASFLSEIELCIFPPYVFIDRARRQLIGSLFVGSQNAWDAAPGFKSTGVVTADMLHAVGCKWVLLGHSDRRNTLLESDALIREKVAKCLENGLSVNLTIGETLEARNEGKAMDVLTRQLGAAAAGVAPDSWARVAVAYEPVWAIGEGATPCSPAETQQVHAALRAWLRDSVSEEAARNCRLVYTGSVNEKNAESYARLPDVDGFVVGRAGLDVSKLMSICNTLVQCKSNANS